MGEPRVLAKDLKAQDLGEVFQRLNTQGYEMSGEDLFFSALKIRWPKAHDLVWAVYGDEHTGRFLPPTKILPL